MKHFRSLGEFLRFVLGKRVELTKSGHKTQQTPAKTGVCKDSFSEMEG